MRQAVMWIALFALAGPTLVAMALLGTGVVEAVQFMHSGRWFPDTDVPGLNWPTLLFFAAVSCVALYTFVATARATRSRASRRSSGTWGMALLCAVALIAAAGAMEETVCLERVPCVSSIGRLRINFHLVDFLVLWDVGICLLGLLSTFSLWILRQPEHPQ
jgi:hypothetical protein